MVRVTTLIIEVSNQCDHHCVSSVFIIKYLFYVQYLQLDLIFRGRCVRATKCLSTMCPITKYYLYNLGEKNKFFRVTALR